MFDITWLAGHAKTNFHHHSSTTPLITKSGSKTTLSDLVKSSTPPCRLNPLLFNGHLQTMYTAVKEAGPPVYYKRHIFESTHTVYPGQFVVDFVVPPSVGKESTPNPELPERTTFYSAKEIEQIGKDDEKPMLICLHGLSGGSHEIYLRHVVAPITAAGWECCVVNARGCALSKVTTPHLFNARSTWDLRQTVKWLRQTFPNRPLYAVGFSMGANILSNFCGEEGANCELKAAVSCSNPWNLELSHWALRRTWIGHGLYLKVLGKSVVGLYEKNKEVVLQNKKIDHEKVMQCKYLYEFDR
jgi:predicted alpha/beta-fold hydrolase